MELIDLIEALESYKDDHPKAEVYVSGGYEDLRINGIELVEEDGKHFIAINASPME
jgi:hypothetical protein